MKYKIVRAGERCRIVVDNPQVFGAMREVHPNLEKNELMISGLISSDCPKKSGCVKVDRQGFSSICRHIVLFPAVDSERVLSCFLVVEKNLKVILTTAACPLNRDNCLVCDNYMYHEIPSCGEWGQIKKSHAFVKCGAVEKPESK